MVEIDPFAKDSGFTVVKKMKHKSMGRNKEDEFERDKRKFRIGLTVLVVTFFIWSIGVIVLQSGNLWGGFIRNNNIEQNWCRFGWIVPAASFAYVMYKAWMIRYNEENA